MKARIAILVAVFCAALPAASADAYSLLGQYWDDPVIDYYASSPGEQAASRYAARAWNRAGTGLRFRRTPAGAAPSWWWEPAARGAVGWPSWAAAGAGCGWGGATPG